MKNERVKISAFCVKCLIDKQFKIAEQMENETEKAAYMRLVLQILHENMDRLSTPVIESYFAKSRMENKAEKKAYQSIKKRYNDMFLSSENEIYQRIMQGVNPVRKAIQYIQMGNYIDFGVNDTFNVETLGQLMNTVENNIIYEDVYSSFLKECTEGKQVVYLLDNCGEAVLDKIFIRVLKKLYPNLEITAVVRGENVVNDVTMEDAEYISLDSICKVVSNGTNIAGTSMEHISREAGDAVRHADFIISKGQGNFETMYGTGFNTYYIFLCKCEWFMKRFHCKKNTAVFQREDEISLILQNYDEEVSGK